MNFNGGLVEPPLNLVNGWVFKYHGTLQWRDNWRDSVSNHQPHDCLLNRLFRRRSKKTSKLRATGLCAGNSPGTGYMACVSLTIKTTNILVFRVLLLQFVIFGVISYILSTRNRVQNTLWLTLHDCHICFIDGYGLKCIAPFEMIYFEPLHKQIPQHWILILIKWHH